MAFLPHTPTAQPLQYQHAPPPIAPFQPQPTWGGIDYYRAHAVNPEPSLYEDVWGKVRNFSNVEENGLGVGIYEARHWHRRVYNVPGEIHRLLPAEIGYAAAYEAYRTWVNNSSMYEVVGGDIERQREALVGLAVAEASRLLQHSSRQLDRYTQSVAAEAAAHTVIVLFYQERDGHGSGYHRSRAASWSDSPLMGGSVDDHHPRSRSRSRSRHRHRHHSLSPSGHSPHRYYLRSYDNLPPGPESMAMPIPHAPSYSGASGMYGSGSYGSPPDPIMQMNMPESLRFNPYMHPIQPSVITPPYQTAPYPSAYPNAPLQNASAIPIGMRNNPVPYGLTPMSSTPWYPHHGAPSMPSQAPTVVVVKHKKRHRRHRR
ncbi:hypothetical protein AMATHDRAFT_2502 [Amanita thiersii Skay4041]|uniref:Uncharacterized protein n=1 Tax=Amanita thiersii Skay4041 TaxID=703135 RepID=A0A2A9NWC6_9AGAR|nr:hypothetical protein AMATHDRAFT_2502 [Amanita thiersii Skay4041]